METGKISFISKKATFVMPRKLDIYLQILNEHLQSSQGSKQLDHIPFIFRVVNILSSWTVQLHIWVN